MQEVAGEDPWAEEALVRKLDGEKSDAVDSRRGNLGGGSTSEEAGWRDV